MEEQEISGTSETACKRRKSTEDDAEGAENTLMEAEAVVGVVTEVEVEDCCSESDSRSTPTKNDKSSSDSGVCSKMEDEEKVFKTTTWNERLTLVGLTKGRMGFVVKAKPAVVTDADVIVGDNAGTPDTSPGTEGVMADLDSGFDVACNVSMATSKMKEEKEAKEENEQAKCSKTTESAADGTGIDSGNVDTGVVQTSPWSRHPRRGQRNYRRNTGSATAMNEDTVDADDSTINVTSTVAANVAEQSELEPLIASPLFFNEVSANSDMVSDGENSAAAHAASDMSTSQVLYDSSSSSSSFSDDDDDDDDDDDEDDEHDTADKGDQADTLAEVMNKPKPQYTWNSTYELMRREHGLSGNGRHSLRSGVSGGFNARFYSSRHVVERMKLSHCLLKHNGCVNCLNFNRSGDLLCSGSDDTRIIVWHWAQKKPQIVFKSGHTENIFQTKFIDSVGVLDIVSASRDGQVRRSIIPPSGGKPQTSQLYRHHGSVHKLVVSPRNRFEIISAGEDGHIRGKDLRSDASAASMCKVVNNSKKRKVRLFSIAHHPFAPEICVCGCDNFVRIYDKRNMSKAVHQMCPEHLAETSIPQVTCSVYNSTGSEVLASYSDDHIYLFNNVEYKAGEYLHRYRGHYNHKTIKGVNFFGPNSEYVISGSDCGNIFFWDKNTEAIINFMPGDTMGVVNCLEPHPSIPVLATSGLDHNIKIWTPSSEVYPPDLSKLEQCVKRNLRRSVIDEGNEFDDRQFHYFIRQFLRRPRRNIAFMSDDYDGHESSSSSSSSSEDYECPQMESIQCHNEIELRVNTRVYFLNHV